MSTSNPETEAAANAPAESRPSNFIRDIILDDLKTNKYDGRVQTRFPPEPNGYLHIGHAKAICLDFGLANEFGGHTNLRFDDTNPEKEETEYVDSIMEDVEWLGFQWDGLYYASDYFDQLYDWAVQLIKTGKAYVDDLSADEIREYRGTLTEPGKDSPFRNRSVEENLDLFERMRDGEFPDGARVLRAKIDMASPNLNMRDPVMYRILHADHHRTGNKWSHLPHVRLCARPVGLARARHPLHVHAGVRGPPPALQLVHQAAGNLPFAADRVRPPQPDLHAAEQAQAAAAGAGRPRQRLGRSAHAHPLRHSPPRLHARSDSQFLRSHRRLENHGSIELAMLEHFVREDLNKRAPRAMAVLRPLKVVIDNYPENQAEEMDAVNNPEDPERRARAKFPFSASSTSSRTTSARSRPRNISVCLRDAKSACATATSSPARAS